MDLQFHANIPQHPANTRKQPAMRLKNPLARKRFKEAITCEWKKIKDAHFHTVEDRYNCYTATMHEALSKVEKLPKIGERSIQLIKLRQQHRMAHWKYKTLTARGHKADIQRETRDNIGAEYRRKLKRMNSKNMDLRRMEQIIATTPDCWKMIKKVRLQQRKRNHPTNTLNEEDKTKFEEFWENIYTSERTPELR